LAFENISPTRINLIQTRRTLSIAESGREVLERKRDVLLRELRHSIFDAEKAREEANEKLLNAYKSLLEAISAQGTETIELLGLGSSFEADFLLDFRSIMGVTVPIVEFLGESDVQPDYGFGNTNAALDKAFGQFYQALDVLADLATAEGISFQLANDVKKTQRRVNALNHVLIPGYKQTVKQIEQVLEEKEREEFVRTKRVKNLIRERKSF
jgi:V/A-type H+-transporting ATPase subunit D